MIRMTFSRLLSMLTILFYSTALAQTGQVITQDEKSWAKMAVQQTEAMPAVGTPNSIAVLYFNNKSGQDKLNPLQKGMAVMLINDLEKLEQLQVVSRVRMQALLDEMGVGTSGGIVDMASVSTVAKLLGAYFVTSGDIQKGINGEVVIDSSVLDVPFETLTRQPIVTGTLAQLFKLEKKILFNIIDQLQITLSPVKKIELQTPLSTSTTALLALFLGIDHSDKGQYAKAMKMYEQALNEDPNLTMARTGLQELKDLMGNSVGEGAVSDDEPLSPPAVEVEDSSMTTYIGIGLAVAAVGGLALAMSSSGSGSDNTAPPVDPSPVDTTSPTVVSTPVSESEVQCAEGSIEFSFSEAMNTAAGQVSIYPNNFAGGSWSNGQKYIVSWTHTSTPSCTVSSLVVAFADFQDTAGNVLTGVISFGYTVLP